MKKSAPANVGGYEFRFLFLFSIDRGQARSASSAGVTCSNLPPEAGLSRPELLHELFERQAAASPDRTAIICAEKQLAYSELERRANQLARFLQRAGVARGDCVGLLLPRSTEVYVALLAILKAGAAYVPLDPDYPAERVSFILSDCHARALVTSKTLASKASTFAGQVVKLDEGSAELSSLSSDALDGAETGLTPNDLCYIIYTSGTTGQPKGVQIEHRSVCHLVRAEAEIFRIQPEDRVYQGFSIAFDASVEEIWLAFFAGATLVAGTQEMVRAGPALSRLLRDAGITVLSCVPTLLLMMDEDVPSLRLLILGGEACLPDLIKRWWKPNRRVFNTYGPTEATVVATWAECHPDKPVTIGRPLPNYQACILDERMQPAAAGVAGELCLGGIGLARGYLGQPELTLDKFIFSSVNGGASQRLYRTGDLARWTPEGNLDFLGRIDSQVKIRGFRVELGEIEAVLRECVGVKAAAVTLHEDASGLQQLIGYIVTRGEAQCDEEGIRCRLRQKLPAYMVPALFEILPQLPMLPSGKVDRKRLPSPAPRTIEARPGMLPPRTPLEKRIAGEWQKLFAPLQIFLRDDFFLDLGGHSLLAARMVSELRKTPGLEGLSMLDVYQHPTIESLAARFQIRHQSPGVRPSPAAAAANARTRNEPPEPSAHSNTLRPGMAALRKNAPRSTLLSRRSQTKADHAPPHIPFWRHFFCGTAQLFSLFFILSFFALQWLAPYLTYTILIEEEYDVVEAILGAFSSLIVLYPLMLAIPIAVKWLVIGRYRSGAYPLWGSYYFRWWLVTTIEAAVPVGYLSGTPLLNIYLRLMGAKIGPNAHLDSDSFAIYDLLSIGEDSSINVDSTLLGYTVEDGLLKIGRINIGKRCFVGARAAVGENTVMDDDSALEDLSLLPSGSTIPRAQTWIGSPAQPHNPDLNRNLNRDPNRFPSVSAPSTLNSLPRQSQATAGQLSTPTRGLLHAIGLLIFPVLVVAALFPGIVVMNKLNYIDPYYWYLFLAPLGGLSFILLLALEIAAIKWLLLGKVKPGRYPLHSFYYLRKWFFGQTMDLSLDVLGPLYASIYLTPWYKLLGAKLGKGAEVSTASFISPDLLSIGDESFIADSVSLGAPRVRDGFLTIGTNHIGTRSFIGNSAMLPPGAVIGDKVLIGCLSAPPANPADALREDTTWMGSPAIFLPHRQKSAAFSDETTFNPSTKLRVQRAIIEFVRVITPSTCFIILISLLFSSLLLLRDYFTLVQTLAFFPFLYLACGLAAALLAIVAKWALIWRYRPCEKPLWSTYVWRNELLNALHEHLAEPFLVGALTGTPFVCWYFRLLGARIGRRVYMETTDLSEFDLATIGDEAALNADCTIQTHLFEDRVMKMSTINIAPRCKIGAGSLVLYDTQMETGATLGDLSLLMKGETLPANTSWQGIPAQPSPSVPAS